MILSWTDIVVILILVILACNGTYQGFLRTLVGPGCFLLASAVGYQIYAISHQPMVGVFIALAGPLILTWGLNSFIRAKLGDRPTNLTLTSQLSGAFINLVWGGSILLLSLLMITMIPFNQTGLNAVKNDMQKSYTYRALEKVIVGKKFEKKKACSADSPTGACSLTDTDIEALQSDKDIQDLMNDPRIQKILNNPELRTAAEKKDIAALMKSSAMLDLAQDPELIGKFFKVYPKIKARMNDPQ
jgi:uncharacterized membrane protein required for colicin V production